MYNFTLIFSKISYNFAVGFIYFLLVKVNINIGHGVPSMPESSCNRFFGYVQFGGNGSPGMASPVG